MEIHSSTTVGDRVRDIQNYAKLWRLQPATRLDATRFVVKIVTTFKTTARSRYLQLQENNFCELAKYGDKNLNEVLYKKYGRCDQTDNYR